MQHFVEAAVGVVVHQVVRAEPVQMLVDTAEMVAFVEDPGVDVEQIWTHIRRIGGMKREH